MVIQIFLDRWNARLSTLHQFDRTACKLCFRLNEIPPICKQCRRIREHNQCSGRSCKPGHIFSFPEICSNIFGCMKVIRSNHISIYTCFLHFLTQLCQLLYCRHHIHLLMFYIFRSFFISKYPGIHMVVRGCLIDRFQVNAGKCRKVKSKISIYTLNRFLCIFCASAKFIPVAVDQYLHCITISIIKVIIFIYKSR